MVMFDTEGGGGDDHLLRSGFDATVADLQLVIVLVIHSRHHMTHLARGAVNRRGHVDKMVGFNESQVSKVGN